MAVDALASYRKEAILFWERRRLIFLATLAVLTLLAYIHYSAPKHHLA